MSPWSVHIWLMLLVTAVAMATEVKYNKKGYIVYCPCMGRFGNQADHFLGVLAWAKAMDRTLVLPPWVEYHPSKSQSIQVPFKTYFKVKEITKYTRAMTMENFMKKLAPTIWPVGKRTVYCYSGQNGGQCRAKDGNPFKSFWDTFHIDFDASEFYQPLSFTGDDPFEIERWNKRFPSSKHLVLAFMGSPASFPSDPSEWHLHKYIKWSDNIARKRDAFIEKELIQPFIGIHMRNGIDWKNACSHSTNRRGQLFSSAQCLGSRNQHGPLSAHLCLPSDEMVVAQLAHEVEQRGIKSVYVAADDRDLLHEFRAKMKHIKFIRYPSDHPHVDLAIVAKASYAIVNCISTFSAFIARERNVNGLETGFWAFPADKYGQGGPKVEL